MNLLRKNAMDICKKVLGLNGIAWGRIYSEPTPHIGSTIEFEGKHIKFFDVCDIAVFSSCSWYQVRDNINTQLLVYGLRVELLMRDCVSFIVHRLELNENGTNTFHHITDSVAEIITQNGKIHSIDSPAITVTNNGIQTASFWMYEGILCENLYIFGQVADLDPNNLASLVLTYGATTKI